MPDREDAVLAVVTGVARVVVYGIGVHHTGLLVYVQMPTHIASNRETATAAWVGTLMGYVSDVNIERCLRDEIQRRLTLFASMGVHMRLDHRGQLSETVPNRKRSRTYLQAAGPVKGLVALRAYMAAGTGPTDLASALRRIHVPIGPSRVRRGRVSGVIPASRAGSMGCERGQLNVLAVHWR